jgi:hypothetical protein
MLRNLLLIDFAGISLPAGFKKSAGLAGGLLEGIVKMLANIPSERQCEVIKLDEVARRRTKFEERPFQFAHSSRRAPAKKDRDAHDHISSRSR